MKIETETLREDAESRYPDALDCAINNELRVILAQGLKRLPSKQRLFIVEDLWDSKSYRAIGREQGCAYEHVRKLKSKGLNKLREILSFLAEDYDSPNMPDISKRIQPVRAKRQYIFQDVTMTPSQRKERARQQKHQWYLEKLLENKRKYNEDKAYHHWRSARWQQKNAEAWKVYQQQYHKQRSENLGDAFVAEKIIAGTDLTKQDIPHKLIILKRKELILSRFIERKGES